MAQADQEGPERPEQRTWSVATPGPVPAVTPPPAIAPPGIRRRPARVEEVAGTPFSLAIYGAPPAVSGPAVGALVAGIAGILVSVVVGCTGLLTAMIASTEGPVIGGLQAGGAFALLAAFLGLTGVGLGLVGIRRTRVAGRPAGDRVGGRAMAVAGLACGGVALLITVCGVGMAGIAALG